MFEFPHSRVKKSHELLPAFILKAEASTDALLSLAFLFSNNEEGNIISNGANADAFSKIPKIQTSLWALKNFSHN